MAPGFNRTEAEARDYYIKKQARKEIPMMKADGDRYDTQMIGENAGLVLCECHVYVPQEYKLVISEVQRVTMLMRRDGEHIFITHIHASNPWFAVTGRYHVEELMHHFHVENRSQLLARARSQPRSKK